MDAPLATCASIISMWWDMMANWEVKASTWSDLTPGMSGRRRSDKCDEWEEQEEWQV